MSMTVALFDCNFNWNRIAQFGRVSSNWRCHRIETAALGAFLIVWIRIAQYNRRCSNCSLASSGAHLDTPTWFTWSNSRSACCIWTPYDLIYLHTVLTDRWNWIFAVCSSSFFVTCRRRSISGNTACTTNATNSKFRSVAKRLCNACWYYGRHACNVPNWSNCRLTHVEL